MRARSVLLVAGGVGYSLGAASTTPFTLPADVLTGVVVAAMAVSVLARWPLRTRKARAVAGRSVTARSAHPYLPWLGLFLACVAWELFNYLVHGTRSNHPTFSSMADAVDRSYPLKALVFLLWLALGRLIVDRGSRSRAGRLGTIEPAEA